MALQQLGVEQMKARIGAVLLAGALTVTVACMPGAGEISGASDSELDRACAALSRVGYDYWQLDPIAIGGRLMEVSADIHTAHPGSDNTRKYCEGR